MFYKFTLGYGKPVCVLLYSVFAALAAKGIWIPLVCLAGLHLAEYIAVGFKVGKDSNQGYVSSFLNCLCFGFTWWLPIKKKQTKAN